MFRWLSLNQLLKYEKYIIKANVSKIARSKDGFLSAKVPNENIFWEQKRNAFIERVLPSYQANPTYRRWLSLIAWGYKADKLH